MPLVDLQLVLLPVLLVKLGLSRSSVKALDENSDGLNYLKQKFPKLRCETQRRYLLVDKLKNFCMTTVPN
jgi:hypothetical protein